MDDAALPPEFQAERPYAVMGLLELLAEIGIGLFEALAVADTVAVSLAGDEAEGGREQYPHW